jgi:glycerophosphoryl diester phosphodiesterase
MASGRPVNLPVELAPVVGSVRRVFCCHRATLSGAHPPNSLEAVVECVEAGAPRLEIDVRFLADDGMLIFHDSRLDPESTGSGPVAELDSPSARLLRFRADDSVRLAFLEEVADVLRSTETLLQVDLKLMRPISAARLERLATALAPLRDHCLIGSQAHWNTRPLAEAGFRVALDPTLQWHYRPGRSGEGLNPARLGIHGLWDDAPEAHMPGFGAADYVEARVNDLLALCPAVEWMVDYATICHLGALGAPLGHLLGARGVELAAWTVKDAGAAQTRPLLDELCHLGVTTFITDSPLNLAEYAAA